MSMSSDLIVLKSLRSLDTQPDLTLLFYRFLQNDTSYPVLESLSFFEIRSNRISPLGPSYEKL
jgi:hypothetical protein